MHSNPNGGNNAISTNFSETTYSDRPHSSNSNNELAVNEVALISHPANLQFEERVSKLKSLLNKVYFKNKGFWYWRFNLGKSLIMEKLNKWHQKANNQLEKGGNNKQVEQALTNELFLILAQHYIQPSKCKDDLKVKLFILPYLFSYRELLDLLRQSTLDEATKYKFKNTLNPTKRWLEQEKKAISHYHSETTSMVDFINRLPVELSLKIMNLLTTEELFSTRRVNKEYQNLSGDVLLKRSGIEACRYQDLRMIHWKESLGSTKQEAENANRKIPPLSRFKIWHADPAGNNAHKLLCSIMIALLAGKKAEIETALATIYKITKIDITDRDAGQAHAKIEKSSEFAMVLSETQRAKIIKSYMSALSSLMGRIYQTACYMLCCLDLFLSESQRTHIIMAFIEWYGYDNRLCNYDASAVLGQFGKSLLNIPSEFINDKLIKWLYSHFFIEQLTHKAMMRLIQNLAIVSHELIEKLINTDASHIEVKCNELNHLEQISSEKQYDAIITALIQTLDQTHSYRYYRLICKVLIQLGKVASEVQRDLIINKLIEKLSKLNSYPHRVVCKVLGYLGRYLSKEQRESIINILMKNTPKESNADVIRGTSIALGLLGPFLPEQHRSDIFKFLLNWLVVDKVFIGAYKDICKALARLGMHLSTLPEELITKTFIKWEYGYFPNRRSVFTLLGQLATRLSEKQRAYVIENFIIILNFHRIDGTFIYTCETLLHFEPFLSETQRTEFINCLITKLACSVTLAKPDLFLCAPLCNALSTLVWKLSDEQSTNLNNIVNQAISTKKLLTSKIFTLQALLSLRVAVGLTDTVFQQRCEDQNPAITRGTLFSSSSASAPVEATRNISRARTMKKS